LTRDCITSFRVHVAAKTKRRKDTAFAKRIVAAYAEIAGRAALSAEINLVIEGTKPESLHEQDITGRTDRQCAR
jgi:hypothetical protein